MVVLAVGSRRHITLPSSSARRFMSRGALGGGFTKEGLHKWFTRETRGKDKDDNDEERTVYADLDSQKVSTACTAWLDKRSSPASDLARAFFGSPRFVPERIVLAPFLFFSESSSSLPGRFQIDTKFLLWTTTVVSPYEIILSWKMGSGGRGCTMMSFDPRTRKVYQGNCITGISSVSHKNFNSFHLKYAQFLLGGMVNALEKEAQK